mgnify:CR=1 FL=1
MVRSTKPEKRAEPDRTRLAKNAMLICALLYEFERLSELLAELDK